MTLAAVHFAEGRASPPAAAPASGAAATDAQIPLVPAEPSGEPARDGAKSVPGRPAAAPADRVESGTTAPAAPAARSQRPRAPKRAAVRASPALADPSPLGGQATVEIQAPAGSAVEIDGIHRGVAPFAAPLPLAEGSHLIRVTKGRGVYDTRLSARSGEDYVLDVTFVGEL